MLDPRTRPIRAALILVGLFVAGCGGSPRDGGTTTTTAPAATPEAKDTAAPLPLPEPCYTGAAATVDMGVCRHGVRAFAGGECVGQIVPTPEVCNGQDDDCNGSVDDGLGTIACGLGACEVDAPACVDGAPGTCTPGKARAEVCDGVDNDCNGIVDDDCPCMHVAPEGDDAAAGSAAR